MALIKRMQHPPVYTIYSKYKKFLRIDFEHCCAYCGVREAQDGGSKKFHVDHYKPKSKFPEESNNYSNLYYSCSDCNILKGNYWPSPVQWLMSHLIINPCDYDYEEHYDTSQFAWSGKTRVASWNIDRLRLNSPKNVRFREDSKVYLELIQALNSELDKSEFELQRTDLSRETKKAIELNIQNCLRQKNVLVRRFDPLD